MPEPYPPPPKATASGRFQLGTPEILLLAAFGGGILGYLIGLFNDMARTHFAGLTGAASLIAALLAGLRLAAAFGNGTKGIPNVLYAAAPLSVYASLALVHALFDSGSVASTVVVLVLSAVQSAALVVLLLDELGITAVSGSGSSGSQPPPPPFAPPGQSQQGSGWNQQGKPVPGHFGQPPASPQGGWNPGSGGQPQAPGQGAPAHPAPAPPAPPQQAPGQSQQGQSQQGQPQQGQAPAPGQGPGAGHAGNGGPQGTQQMPHPGQ